ncbi:hypothetical protein BVRB_015420, partial [Beta vulgaris subsp. vulgaris]
EHKNSLSGHRKRKWDNAQNHCKGFMDWFKEKVALKLEKGEVVSSHVKWLSKGPSYVVKKYTGYSVNGYRFYSMKRDASLVTQNSGVTLKALTPSFSSSRDQNPTVGHVVYYGALEEIIELSYHGQFSVVLFRQRLAILKRNAEAMAAKGLGSLANKIYDKSQEFATSLNPLSAWEDRDLYSDMDDDDEYVPNIEGDGDEDGSCIGNKNQTTKATKSGSMADFGKPPVQQKQQCLGVQKQIVKHPITKSKSMSMAEFVKQPEDQQQPQPKGRKHQKSSQVVRTQNKLQHKTFCSPGSLSAYRNLRRTKSNSVNLNLEMESPATNEVENDACEAAHEVQVEPEVREYENMVIESRVDFGPENSPQQRTDSLKEGNLLSN